MEIFCPNYQDYLVNVPQQLIDGMTFSVENIPNFIPFILCMTFGYLLYTESGKVWKKEHIEVYPLYLHCWMITFDVIGTINAWYCVAVYGPFWLFILWGVCFPIWIVMEAQSIIRSCKTPEIRQQNFGRLSKEPISEKTAFAFAIAMVVICFFLNNWAFTLMGGYENFAYYLVIPFSNYVFAIWTWRWWTERAAENGTRKGNSMKLQIVILVQVTLMWVPGLSWYTAIIPGNRNIWFYLIGILVTALAAYNTYKCYKLPDHLKKADDDSDEKAEASAAA